MYVLYANENQENCIEFFFHLTYCIKLNYFLKNNLNEKSESVSVVPIIGLFLNTWYAYVSILM